MVEFFFLSLHAYLNTLPPKKRTTIEREKSMNVFLTGGTGNIGSHVAMELINRGHEVTILARNPNKIPAFQTIKGMQLVKGTLADTDIIKECLVGKDACIHIALNYHEERQWQAIIDDTVPTITLGNSAAEAGVERFIYTSSTSVNDTLYSLENRDPDETIVINSQSAHSVASFYGASKSACENYLLALSYQSKMKVNVIRPGYTFGNPVTEGGSVQADTRFLDLVYAAKKNEAIKLDKNDGTQFIFSGDIAKLYVDLLESPFDRKIYFALAKKFVTWAALAQVIIDRTGSKSELILTDAGHKGGLSWDVSDMEKDFGLVFDPWPKLMEHIDYSIKKCADA